MDMTLVGLSHRTAPIALRERLAFSAEECAEGAADLTRAGFVDEAVLLSTCNRTEVIASAPAGQPIGHKILAFLSERRKLPQSDLSQVAYRYRGAEAISHLFRVASSLDSLVVGEPQILGQVKTAYQAACESGACGPALNRLFHRTFRVAKRVRTETRIAENAVSVSYAGVEMARRIFGTLKGKEALLVGAGEMAELAVEHLLSNGLSHITIANRTAARAAALASRFGGHCLPWERVDEELLKADIVLTSAAVPHPIIRRDRMEPTMKARRFRPLFLIDLGLPRNVEPAVAHVEGCYVFDLDDLTEVVEENKQTRYAEAQRAEAIVAEETEAFLDYLGSLHVVPTIMALQDRMEQIRRAELEKALGTLGALDPAQRERIEYLTTALVKKILHTPITEIKGSQRAGGDREITQAARRLFGIEETPTQAQRPPLQEVAGDEE